MNARVLPFPDVSTQTRLAYRPKDMPTHSVQHLAEVRIKPSTGTLICLRMMNCQTMITQCHYRLAM